jgi:hypothetical protein
MFTPDAPTLLVNLLSAYNKNTALFATATTDANGNQVTETRMVTKQRTVTKIRWWPVARWASSNEIYFPYVLLTLAALGCLASHLAGRARPLA